MTFCNSITTARFKHAGSIMVINNKAITRAYSCKFVNQIALDNHNNNNRSSRSNRKMGRHHQQHESTIMRQSIRNFRQTMPFTAHVSTTSSTTSEGGDSNRFAQERNLDQGHIQSSYSAIHDAKSSENDYSHRGEEDGEKDSSKNDAHSFELTDKELLQQIYQSSHQYMHHTDHAPVSLRDLLETPLLDEYAGGVVISEDWIERQVMHRIAKQIVICDTLPLGLNLMPSIVRLRGLYVKSYVELMKLLERYKDEKMQMEVHGRLVPEDDSSWSSTQLDVEQPESVTTEHFVNLFMRIHKRHENTLQLVGMGINELKALLRGRVYGSEDVPLETVFFQDLQNELHGDGNGDMQLHLDQLCKTHIGLSMLLDHHVELFFQYNPLCSESSRLTREKRQKERPLFGHSLSSYKGIVCMKMQASKVLQSAIDGAKEHTRLWYESRHRGANVRSWIPDVKVNHVITPEGETEEPTFAYVPTNLYFVLYELLKNSLVASINKARPWECEDKELTEGPSGEVPPIEVSLIQNASNEDMCFKITDRGGGITRSMIERVFRYILTHDSTESSPEFQRKRELTSRKDIHIAQNNSGGLGMGLLSAKHYAEFFGGSLQLHGLESFGTDVYVYISISNVGEDDLTM